MQVYISVARLNDAPQVRITSSPMCPWISLESCREWCEKHCFSFIIKEVTKNSPRVDDNTLYNSDKPPVVEPWNTRKIDLPF